MDTTARVEAGAELLDLVNPGWADHIDLGKLDVESECACVLARLHGSYSAGRNFLFGHCEEVAPALAAADHGFFAYAAIANDANRNDPAIEDEYADLTYGWMQLIRERRIAA